MVLIKIQSRKLIVDGATRCREFLALIRGAVQRAAAQEQASSLREAVSQSVDLLERVSSQMMEWSAQGRAADIEAGAVAYLRLAGLVGCGWMWLRMAVQDSGSPELNASKRACAEYFVQALLPETRLLAHQATLGTAGAELSGAQWQAGW